MICFKCNGSSFKNIGDGTYKCEKCGQIQEIPNKFANVISLMEDDNEQEQEYDDIEL